jgi:hypothetical protein
MKKFSFISTANIAFSIFLLATLSVSIFSLVFAAAPNPGHNFSTIGGGAVQGDIIYGSAADTLSALAKDTNATRYLSNTGASNNPAWAQIDLTNGVTGTLPAGNGGSGNAFFQVSGPASTVKTFTFPNANSTVLTTNAAVTVAQGGTGSAPSTDDQVLIADSSSGATWRTVNDCTGAGKALTYAQSSNSIGCNTITTGSTLLDGSVHTDTAAGSVVRGDVIVGNATPAWARLAKGTANQVLSMDSTGTDVVWTDDMGYTLNVQALTSSPVDATTIYFGQLPKAPVTVAATSKVYVREAGTIRLANIYCYSGTAGTAENWSVYIRKNNATDYLIQTVGAATSERVFSSSTMAIPMAAGDYFEIKAINPTWVTNPLTTIFGGYIYIE